MPSASVWMSWYYKTPFSCTSKQLVVKRSLNIMNWNALGLSLIFSNSKSCLGVSYWRCHHRNTEKIFTPGFSTYLFDQAEGRQCGLARSSGRLRSLLRPGIDRLSVLAIVFSRIKTSSPKTSDTRGRGGNQLFHRRGLPVRFSKQKMFTSRS